MGRCIGIVFGEKTCVMAVADDGEAHVLRNREGQFLAPAVVGLRCRQGKDQELLVGQRALMNWPLAPKDTIISIRRLLGRGVADWEVQKVREYFRYQVVEPREGTKDSVRVVLGGKEYSPEEISAMILRKIKEDAEFRLGEEVTDAVITVPAYFGRLHRAVTRRAGQKAGLRILNILDEPIATAIAYGMEKVDTIPPKYFCVYDLGGGTFTFSVFRTGNVFTPMNWESDTWLGGDAFDSVLINQASKNIERNYSIDPRENIRFMAELNRRAIHAKECLSTATTTEILVPSLLQSNEGDLIDVYLDVRKSDFEDLVRPLVDKSIELARKALKGADLTPEQVDYVLIAGHSSVMPLVQEAVETFFGPSKIKRDIHPKYCVSIGAAKLPRVLSEIVCRASDSTDLEIECGNLTPSGLTLCGQCGPPLDMTDRQNGCDYVPPWGIGPYSLGVQLASDQYHVLIKRNEPFPTASPQAQTLYTPAYGQRIVSMPIYMGDNKERASANDKQADVWTILPPGLPKGTGIRLKVWLDRDGIMDLSAEMEDGTHLQPVMCRVESDIQRVCAAQRLWRMDDLFKEIITPLDLWQLRCWSDRETAFESFQSGQFGAAEEFADRVERISNTIPHPTWEADMHSLRLADFLMQEYAWILGDDLVAKIRKLTQGVVRKEESVSRLTEGTKDEILLLQELFALYLPSTARALMQCRELAAVGLSWDVLTPSSSVLKDLREIEIALHREEASMTTVVMELQNRLSTMVVGNLGDKSSLDSCLCNHAWHCGEVACPMCKLPRGLLGKTSPALEPAVVSGLTPECCVPQTNTASE
jgi:molecular chaperone DnaK